MQTLTQHPNYIYYRGVLYTDFTTTYPNRLRDPVVHVFARYDYDELGSYMVRHASERQHAQHCGAIAFGKLCVRIPGHALRFGRDIGNRPHPLSYHVISAHCDGGG